MSMHPNAPFPQGPRPGQQPGSYPPPRPSGPIGQAAIEVHVPAGGTVELFYAAPVHQFTTGAIGFEKQKVKGMAAFWAMMAVLAVLVVASIVVAVQNG